MTEEPKNQIRELPKIQRRVLGALMEKAFTTPEQYPLTLKATATACNQKSNRDPVVGYSEDQVQQALDDLRSDLLVAEVFMGGGRTARYRHYMRHKFDFSEAQFAIIAELLLRGRQQLGELRTRASRMVRIESQDQLREELDGLQKMGYLQANGPLERRGIEVDHTFYLPKEGMEIGNAAPEQPEPAASPASPAPAAAAPSAPVAANAPAVAAAASGVSEALVARLETVVSEQADTIRELHSLVSELDDRLQRLERDLGV